jgi:transcriptional regulator with XRE-family HTH domain
MSHHKQYNDVSQMVRDTALSPEFADEFEKLLADRRLIKKLLIMRASQALSQQDIAKKLKCTQSRVSKLENSIDSDLRLGDILSYSKAAGFRAQITFFKENLTLAEEAKYHFFRTAELMQRLAVLAQVSPDIANGIARFFNEVGYNFMMMILEKADSLPEVAREEMAFVRLVDGSVGDHETEEGTSNGHAQGRPNGTPIPA